MIREVSLSSYLSKSLLCAPYYGALGANFQKRKVDEFITEHELADIGTTQHTHEWGRQNCRIHRVLTWAGRESVGNRGRVGMRE